MEESSNNNFFDFHFSDWQNNKKVDKWYIDFENRIKNEMKKCFTVGEKIDKEQIESKIFQAIKNSCIIGNIYYDYGFIKGTRQLGIEMKYITDIGQIRAIKILVG